ncbi:MAG: hypothetical protein AAFZ63_01270 [Bacteroidota bacterium]
MRRNIFFLLALSFLSWQCAGDATTTETEDAQEEVQPEEEQAVPPVVAQAEPAREILSASQTFEKYQDRYAQLHQTVSKNLDAVNTAIDKSTYPEKLKSGLKSSFEEVSKYNDIQEICQTSKYTSAETVEQFMEGLEMYLTRWGIK